MHLMAIASTAAMVVLVLAWASDVAVNLLYVPAGLAVLASTLLLIRVFRLTTRQERWSSSARYWIQAHLVLHLVPLSYLILLILKPPSLQANILYLLPVLLFFYSGRKTWQVLFEQFGSKVYRVFFAGNTGMMVGYVVLISLGAFYDTWFGTELFCRALVGYFTIHLLILGAAVVKIENDLASVAVDSSVR